MIPQEIELINWHGARRACKLPVDVTVHFPDADGVCETLEGPVTYQAHDPVLIGVRGEKWTMPRAKFERDYAAVHGQEGVYRKLPLMVHVLRLNDALDVAVSGGVLHGAPGDWLVQYAPGDFGIVTPDIFAATYQLQTL